MDLIPKELERVRNAIKIRYGQWPKDRLRLCGLEMILNLNEFDIFSYMYKDNVIYLQDSPCV